MNNEELIEAIQKICYLGEDAFTKINKIKVLLNDI